MSGYHYVRVTLCRGDTMLRVTLCRGRRHVRGDTMSRKRLCQGRQVWNMKGDILRGNILKLQ